MVEEEKEKKVDSGEEKVENKDVSEKKDTPNMKKVKVEDTKPVNSEPKGKTMTDKMRENPWVVSTIVLAVLALIFFVGDFSGGATGASVAVEDADAVGLKIVNLINSQSTQEAELVGVEEESGLYKVTFSTSQGENSVYTTLDGDNIINGLIPMQTLEQAAGQNSGDTNNNVQPSTNEVPKSDKPKVELFVMSICPFGTQAEKGLLPVLETLGDEIDFNLRFVSYAMHGKEEIDENTVQYCIQEEEPDKLYNYLNCYLEEQDPAAWDACIDKVDIDRAAVESCVEETDAEYSITELFNDESSWNGGRYPPYNVDVGLNAEYGVRGSPTLIVNGVKVNSARDPASYLDTICGAFNEAPEECDTELSSTPQSPGFGWEELSAGANTQAAQCG